MRSDEQQARLDFNVEHLESRRMLAGNIRVLTNNAGDVTIKGDGKSNHVEVSKTTNGDILIEGTPDTFGNSTGIKIGRNIVSQIVLPADDGRFSRNLTIKLGGGNDFLVIRDITIDGDFNYNPGGKSDSLGFFQSSVTGTSTLKTGGGNDYLNFVDTTFHGNVDAVTGGGVDFIGLSNFAIDSGVTASFNTGGGGDVIYIEDSTIEGNLAAEMGAMIDTVYVAAGTTINGSVDIDMGNLFDFLAIENDVNIDSATLNLDGGKGGFGYDNQLFLYADSPYGESSPAGLLNFTADLYTIADTPTTEPTLEGTLTKWIVDDYYGQTPSVSFSVIEALQAANMARGFEYGDLPRSDAPAPDPAELAGHLIAHLNSPDYDRYQKTFVKIAFETEIATFDWSSYGS